MTMPKIYSRKEAARVAQMSTYLIDQAVNSGDLEAKVYGGRTLIFEHHLEAFLANLKSAKAAGNPRSARLKAHKN